jgi:hypothetical protein
MQQQQPIIPAFAQFSTAQTSLSPPPSKMLERNKLYFKPTSGELNLLQNVQQL